VIREKIKLIEYTGMMMMMMMMMINIS